MLLHLEGTAFLAAALVGNHLIDGSWLWFAIGFLAPDLSFVAYTAGPKTGARCYNAVHTFVLPVVTGAFGWTLTPLALPGALIWIAHVGTDRMLGFGLKYSAGFRETHLSRV